MSEAPCIVVFGSSLTSRSPADLDFAYRGMTYADAAALVARWRDENLWRWDTPPDRMHGQSDWIKPDGSVEIPLRPGQSMSVEIVQGNARPNPGGSLSAYQAARSQKYGSESRAQADEQRYRETRYRP